MINYLFITLLVILSGLFSGLTLGLLGLSKSELETKMKAGSDEIKLQATKIYSVRKNGNKLLCTLLLGNVAVNAALTQLLGIIGPAYLVVPISTAIITFFGEILPQALFQKYALKFGSKLVFLVKMFQILLYIIVQPLSLLLDKILGKELRSYYTKEEFIEEIINHEESSESSIDEDEERVLLAALRYSDKTVYEIMTPKPNMFMLNQELTINSSLINLILQKGFTRIPIFDIDSDHIEGVVNVKTLLKVIGSTETFQLKDFKSDYFEIVNEDLKLDDMLNIFDSTKNHIAIVKNEFGTVTGVVTYEDVIETIIDREIVDESDNVEDLRNLN